jgi:general secretion pathway protein E
MSTMVDRKIARELIERVPYSFVRKNLALPLEEHPDHLLVAIADPLNVNALDELRLMLDKKIRSVVVSEQIILSWINEHYSHEVGATSKLIAGLSEEPKSNGKEEVEVYDLLESNGDDAPIIRLLNLVLSEAISQRASDIHFEPYENDLLIRYRIDGILHQRHAPKREHQAQLLTRIKVLAKLDIAEHRLPQDGRIKMKMGGREIDFRVSTIPVAHGERIVLRILDRGNVSFGLSELGMLPGMLDEFRRLISLPEGIVLVTGPTGSGKTTTLYSALTDTISDEINVMTIEDPVEYKLPGIAQIAVHPKIGLNFATGLRHILRQDPDVIMIGEIRDQETAEIAVQSSLTGHFVLSTLHTNDAPSAITRLVDMGVEPYLLSSTIVGILAQRLVRKICPHCREGYTPSDEELIELDLPREKLNSNTLYRGKGCSACVNSGYQGRHGIYELLTVTDHLQSQIARQLDAGQLRQIALEQGMTSLGKHGAHLVRSGITTASEVLRATRKV